MRMKLTTMLDTSAERAWAEVQTSRLLAHVAWPVLSFAPIGGEPLPAIWDDSTHPVRLRAFGLIPLGRQDIVTSRPLSGPDSYQIRDNGTGDLMLRWDHMITIDRVAPGRCRYSDTVEVEARLLTPFVWAFACLFYAHRQRRWRRLVRRNFTY